MIDPNAQIIDRQVMNGFDGVLVIGDPLLGPHKRVGRADDVWAAGMDKLTQAFRLAGEKNLLPLIVGDILHEAREIGQLLPLIQLLKGRKAVLLPRNSRWAERQQGHVAAILQASGIAYVAGYSARQFQVPLSYDGALFNLTLECSTSWGGKTRLEHGERAYIQVPELGLTITQGANLSTLDSIAHKSVLEMGRMLRLNPSEESSGIYVFSLTIDGLNAHQIESTAVVFTQESANALVKSLELNRDSLFVDKLRQATEEVLEEEGKQGLLSLIDEICGELESDEWVKETLMSLAKDAVEQNAA